jgi:hypothetical protein
MRSITPLRLALLGLVVTTVLGLIGNTLRAAPGAGEQPATGPTTAPSTAPAAKAGPTKPSKNRAWVSGTVLMPDGKPAVGLTVRAEKNEPFAMGGGGQKDTGPKEYPVVTDENGNFLIKEMHINAYLLIAGNQEQGWIYQELTVKPGEETKLGTLKLTKVN